MSSTGNNTSGKIAHVRDSYFDSGEIEYLEKLLTDPKEMAIHHKLLQHLAETLYKKASELMLKVETGEFNEKQMAKAEYQITHLLGAIEDLEKTLILELTKTGDKKRESAIEEQANTLSM